jgi:AcrR family transcriptional regulator
MSITADRRREEKEQRREQIVDAAEVVFSGGGYASATLADVAKQARLSRGLIYFYFTDRDDLYAAVTLRALETLGERFRAAAARHATGLEKVESIGRAYVRFAEEDPDAFQALTWEEARAVDLPTVSGFTASCAEVGCALMEFLISQVRLGMEDGSIRRDAGEPAAIALALKAFVHGMTQLRAQKACVVEPQFGTDMETVLEQGFSMLRRSLAAPV